MNTAKVIDFNKEWCKKRALEFTDIFLLAGKEAGVKYQKAFIPEHKMQEVSYYIGEEFARRGVTRADF